MMISNAYEKADFIIVEFSLDDVLTSSSVVTTIAPSTTLPGTTVSGGLQEGKGDITFNYSDFFQ